jgi:hypothetical protein
MTNKYDAQQYLDIFSAVIANKKLAKEMLRDYSGTLAKHYGIEVSNPEFVNAQIFKSVPALRAHLLSAAAGKPHANALGDCKSPGCLACITTLTTAGAALIAAAIAGFPEDTPAIVAVAEFCGISAEAALEAIQAGITGGFESVVENLCSAMGAC